MWCSNTRQALRDRLLKTGYYRVKMTRDDDRFIPLRGRVEIAKKAKASLFVSIHADSAPEIEARGLSFIYVVGKSVWMKKPNSLPRRKIKPTCWPVWISSEERQDVADILNLAGAARNQ